MIFFPTRELSADPRSYGLEYEDLEITTADDLRLHGWWIPHERPRGVLLFFHGNAGNISDRLDSIEIFHRLGLDVLILDYRGYGQSEGSPSEEGTYRDAEAAWRYLLDLRHVAGSDILVFGRSLGAAVAAWLAQRHRPRALVLESAFTSAPDMAANLLPFLPAKSLIHTRYDNLERVADIRCPLLIVHSRDDELIPFEHGRRLFQAAAPPKSFLEIRGGHNDGFYVSGADYLRGLEDFLSEHLGPRAKVD